MPTHDAAFHHRTSSDHRAEPEFDDERGDDVTWRLLDDGDPDGSAETTARRAALPDDTPPPARIRPDHGEAG